MEGTRLGRVLGPIVKAISKIQAGEEISPADLALESMARRISLLSEEARRELPDRPAIVNLHDEILLADGEPSEDEEEEDEQVAEAVAMVPDARTVQEQISFAVREQLAEQITPDTSAQRVLVEPPSHFSDTKVLQGRDKIDELKLNFSSLNTKGKFSGTKDYQKRGELDVISFLESLSRGQAVMNLTEKEFLQTMINSTTGNPQELLMEWIKQNEIGEMPVSAIYMRFTDSFFFELRPEQALAKLRQLSPTNHSFECLSEAEMQIKQWAKLASLEHKQARKRATMAEWHFKEYYLKIIPEKFSSAMTQSIERLEGLRNREVTSTELVAMTRGFRFEIDSIFYRKNHNQQGKSSTNSGGANAARVKKGKVKTNSVGKVNVMTRQQTRNAADNQAPKPKGNGPSNGKTAGGNGKSNGNKGYTRSSPNNKGSQGNGGHNPMPTDQSTWSEGKNPYKHPHPQTALKSNGCRLCGQSTHIFATCQLFKPHERVVGQSMCPCPLKCYHLQKYCPISASKN